MADREFSAGGIVIKGKKDDLEVLLIKDGYGRWTWPKGKIDKVNPQLMRLSAKLKKKADSHP